MRKPVLISLLLSLFVVDCRKSQKPDAAPTKKSGAVILSAKASREEPSGAGVKVGLVYDMGNKMDKSFNEAAYKGLSRAAKEFGIVTQEIEPARDVDREDGVRTLAEEGYDLIIGVGFAFADAMKAIAPGHPHVRFACLDARVEGLPNVESLVFKEEQGSYLVGLLAGLKTKTQKVGFVGGMDIPLIRKFEAGYRAGVGSVDPGIQVISDYAGVTLTGFNDPFKGKELALAQFDQGADVVYQAAGATGLGVIEAAKERGLFAIGTDANQNDLAPGNVLTSMVKRGDVAVYETIKSVIEDRFIGGIKEFDLSNAGIDCAVDENNKSLLTPEMIEAVENAKKKILSGEIVVPVAVDR